MNAAQKPYPSQRRELRAAEQQWHRDIRSDRFASGWAPARTEWPLWVKVAGIVLWAAIVANGIGAVLGLFWRHP